MNLVIMVVRVVSPRNLAGLIQGFDPLTQESWQKLRGKDHKRSLFKYFFDSHEPGECVHKGPHGGDSSQGEVPFEGFDNQRVLEGEVIKFITIQFKVEVIGSIHWGILPEMWSVTPVFKDDL